MRPGTVRVPAGARATRVQALVPAWAPTKRHGHGKSIVGRCNATHSVLYSSSSNSHSAHRGVDIFVRPVLYGQNAEDPAPPVPFRPCEDVQSARLTDTHKWPPYWAAVRYDPKEPTDTQGGRMHSCMHIPNTTQ